MWPPSWAQLQLPHYNLVLMVQEPFYLIHSTDYSRKNTNSRDGIMLLKKLPKIISYMILGSLQHYVLSFTSGKRCSPD